jgi:hypothetical protein
MSQVIVHFIGTMAGNLLWTRWVHLKKKFKGFPMFFTFENFKKSLLGDMKQWWSRLSHDRRLYCRRHRRSRSSVKRKRNDAKGKKLVMVSKRWTWLEKGKVTFRSFVRSFGRSFVRLSSWIREKWRGETKKWWRGEEGAKVYNGQKKNS